jgi:membrane protein
MGHGKYVSPFGVVILKVLPVLFATMAFALLFRVVPNRHVPKLHALIGAFIAAVVFEAMSRIFGYYISHFHTYTLVYGAFASVPIFLMWIYLSWLTVLFGAVIAASLSHWRTAAAQHFAPAARLLDALRVLQIMENGFQRGRVSTLPELSRTLLLGYDTLENILEELSSADIVRKVVGNGWLLMRDANHIRTTELLNLFLIDRGSLSTKQNDDPLRQWLATCAAQLEQSTDITLQELFARQAA